MYVPAWIARPVVIASLVVALACSASRGNAAPTCDITGNWRDVGKPFLAEVVVDEPPLPDGDHRAFEQELVGLSADCDLEFEYLPSLDLDPDHPGDAIENHFDGFRGLTINNQTVELNWTKTVEKPLTYAARCRVVRPPAGEPLHLTLTWHATRPPRTRLLGAEFAGGDGHFQALGPSEGEGELLVAHGIPFLSGCITYDRNRWSTDLHAASGGYTKPPLGRPLPKAGLVVPWNVATLDAGDAEVRTIHFLGMVHVVDWANGSWHATKGDHSFSHFVGDKAGEIELTWSDGTLTSIPLIFGWNLWYGRPWDMIWHFNQWGGKALNVDYANLFGRDPEKLRLTPEGLALVDGIRPRGSISSNARFIFSVNLQGRRLHSLRVRNVPELRLGPLISAVTLETLHPAASLRSLPQPSPLAANPKLTTLEQIENKSYEPGVRAIMHLLYTFVEELPRLTKPDIPPGYFGPHYDFGPQQDAVYAANYLYNNGPGCGSHIADRGMSCSSPVARGTLIGNYQECSGIWWLYEPYFKSLPHWFQVYRETPPGQLPGLGNAWTRGIGELMREAKAFGYDKFLENYTDWLDRCLLEEAQPPHWNRVAGAPLCARQERQVGDTHEAGVRENDGHGICMWGRYMVYHWGGHTRAWNEKHFPATAASVEWLQWQLDTDTIFPGKRKDVLFTDSECANNSYDIYSSYNCRHGLKLAIRMAAQLDRADLVARWTALDQRLRQGMLDHLVDESQCGPIWHTEPNCSWQDHAHKLVHLHLSTEGDSYTPLQDYARGDELDRKYLEISRNSYRYLMRDKNYNCVRMYGYGQGMMTQAALLLDEMEDATQFVQFLLRHAYLPHLGGWATPEGIIVHRSGNYYVAVNGYAGQDSHLADATKAVRLMLGIDDNQPDHLRLVPRFPVAWTPISIRQFPVLAGGRRQLLDYDYARSDDRHEFRFRLQDNAGPVRIRLGPLPANRRVVSAKANDQTVPFREESSGDSRWAWIEAPAGAESKLELLLGE